MIQTIRYKGDCLEAIGVPASGTAIVDRDVEAIPGDVVWCDSAEAGSISGFLKQLVRNGKKALVRTMYLNGKQNYMFYTAQVFGVVLKICNEDGEVVWRRQDEHQNERILDGQLLAEGCLPIGKEGKAMKAIERVLCGDCVSRLCRTHSVTEIAESDTARKACTLCRRVGCFSKYSCYLIKYDGGNEDEHYSDQS